MEKLATYLKNSENKDFNISSEIHKEISELNVIEYLATYHRLKLKIADIMKEVENPNVILTLQRKKDGFNKHHLQLALSTKNGITENDSELEKVLELAEKRLNKVDYFIYLDKAYCGIIESIQNGVSVPLCEQSIDKLDFILLNEELAKSYKIASLNNNLEKDLGNSSINTTRKMKV